MIVHRPASTARKSDRRRERRVRVSTDVVLFLADAEGQEATIPGRLLDVSPHGARFLTARDVSLNAPVKFHHAGLGVAGRGLVRYCKWSPAGFEVGVEFQRGTGWRPPGSTIQNKTDTEPTTAELTETV